MRLSWKLIFDLPLKTHKPALLADAPEFCLCVSASQRIVASQTRTTGARQNWVVMRPLMPRSKAALTLLLLTLCGCSAGRLGEPKRTGSDGAEAPLIILRAEGDLASFEPLGCVSLPEVRPIHTPADLFPAFRQCVEEGQFLKALYLDQLAHAYATFDMKRVADVSAHQAAMVLKLTAYDGLEVFQDQLSEAAKQFFSSERHALFCEELRRIGPPQYHPVYMIQHGLGAFSDTPGSGLNNDFNQEEAWVEALAFVSCN